MPRPVWWMLMFIGCCLAAGDDRWTREDQEQYNAVSEDPEAAVDTFERLMPSAKRIWEGSHHVSFHEIQEKLQSLQMLTIIDIVLFGFDGLDMASVKLERSALQSHLDHVQTQFDILAMGYPEMNKTEHEDDSVPVKIHYNVIEPKKKLLRAIEQAIESSISAERRTIDLSENDHGFVSIPYSVVDKLIQEEHSLSRMFPTIYVLNPKITDTSSYAYRYETPQRSCPGNFWIASGLESEAVYVWIDIEAGPLNYGPRQAGSGQVMEHSFPRVENYPEKIRDRAIVPDLAAMIHSATQHLLMPQSVSLRLRKWKKLTIAIVHVHDTYIPDMDSMHVEELEGALNQLKRLMLKGQTIEVHNYYVPFGQCDSCTAAYSEALMVGTGRIPGAGLVVREKHFLDPLVLHGWFSEDAVQTSLRDNRNIHVNLRSAESDVWILPVFILELATMKPLAFKEGKQAIGFTDLVLGVRTHGGNFLSDEWCSRHDIQIASANLSRPLLAGVLQAVWGIADTSEIWSPARGRVRDYRWSVGQTPFGELSNVKLLPNTLHRIAKRNYILAHVAQSIREVHDTYELLDKLSKRGLASEVFSKEPLVDFIRRSNVFKSKMALAMTHTGRGEFDIAHYYAKSAKHELKALQKLKDDLRRSGPQPVLVCLHERGGLKFWICVVIGLALAVFLWILRMMRPVKIKPI